MKLLMIGGDRELIAGKKGALYNTLEEFHRHWDEIHIILPKNSSVQLQSIFDNVYLYPSPWPLLLQPLWILRKGLALFKEHLFERMVVHDYPPFYNGIGTWLLWRKIRIPYLLEIMHIPGYPRAANLKEAFYRALTKWSIKHDTRRAAAVRVINKKEVPEFLVSAGVPQHKLMYIPAFYIDLETFTPQQCEKKYDVIFLGRLAENKGIKLFLEAVSILRKPAVVVGEGPLKDDIKTWIREKKLDGLITLHGFAKDSNEIAELLNSSRLLIMPSYNEGGPRVVLESLACGVPVVATPVGIVPDVVDKSSSGKMVGWSSDEIAKSSQELLTNDHMYAECRENGLQVARRFERKKAIKEYADAVRSLTL